MTASGGAQQPGEDIRDADLDGDDGFDEDDDLEDDDEFDDDEDDEDDDELEDEDEDELEEEDEDADELEDEDDEDADGDFDEDEFDEDDEDEDGVDDQYEPGDVNAVDSAPYEVGDVNTIATPAPRGAEAPSSARGEMPVTVLEYLARAMTDDPDAVVIRREERRGSTILRLHVAPRDMGRVIGRRGRTAQAIRTLVGVAGAREGTQTVVDIVDD